MLVHPHSLRSEAQQTPPNKALKIYATSWGVLFICFSLFFTYLGYKNSFLYLNKLGIPLLDPIAYAVTHLGDSGVAGAILVLIGWRTKPEWVVVGLMSLISSGLIVQILKNSLFSNWNRPLGVFETEAYFRYIMPDSLRYQSFPSGHATTCAAVGWFLALIQNRISWSLVLSLVVWVVMLSRVYVGAHFLGDVLAGGMLGITFSITFYYLFKSKDRKLNQIKSYLEKQSSWLNASLFVLSILVAFAVYLSHYK